MKIILRYYNDWGVLQSQTIKLSSKIMVKQLKQDISQLTGIAVLNQQLIYMDGDHKITIDDDQQYISDYKLKEQNHIFVQKLDDSFADLASSFASQFDQNITLLQDSNDQDMFFTLLKGQLFNDAQFYLQGRMDKSVLINDIDRSGWSAMHLVCFLGDQKQYLWLINEGGDVTKISKDGWSCLELSVWQQHLQIVNLILGSGLVDINHISSKGTALHIAANVDDCEIMKALLDHPKINTNIRFQGLLASDMAGSQTRKLLQKESKNIDLLESFRTSICSLYGQNSFLKNKPNKPPIIRGLIQRVSYLKLALINNYFIIDPESEVMARYKQEGHIPMNPMQELIPLEAINEVKLSKDKWFQDPRLYYLEIQYLTKHLHLAFQHKNAARQWLEAIRNSVGYVRYIHSKLQNQHSNQQQRTIYNVLMDKCNQDIEIVDVDGIQMQKKEHQKRSLLSTSEESDKSIPNIRFKDFQILALVGKGSFGHVYKAIYKNKLYALKQQEKYKVLGNLQYIQSEISVLKQLDHPFIVKLYYAFQTQNYLYMAIDYCEKGDLTAYMTQGNKLDEYAAKFIIAQLVLALEYLHDMNIIFRDLKPENIVIDAQGYCKLIDFGLSKEGFNLATTFCGSPAYLSPELLNGLGVTQATDVYCLGLILYEMLTGYPPFYTQHMERLLNGIRNGYLNYDNQLISKSAQNLLKQIIIKDPDQRIKLHEIKQHIFFAEIDWNKLYNKQYQPPKLKQIKQMNIQPITIIEVDYQSGHYKSDDIPGWDYDRNLAL